MCGRIVSADNFAECCSARRFDADQRQKRLIALDHEGSGPGARRPATEDAENATSERIRAQSFEINRYLFDTRELKVSRPCLGYFLYTIVFII